jgi:hypothetical protein
MLLIPEITPVRVKTQQIIRSLIDPGSMGYHFPREVGPRVVYLDERYDYPPQNSNDPTAERARQASIWDQLHGDDGVQFLDRHAEEDDRSKAREIHDTVFAELGHRNSAEYFERVFTEFFQETMDVVIISTGIRPFDGYNYHDIGYLR